MTYQSYISDQPDQLQKTKKPERDPKIRLDATNCMREQKVKI